ncbi:MAG: glycoside hydrolase family 76 protein [Tidjanibacter sp.]|nr:glycoside hydrolase family 76 protein [Tidjanibacter sp.]
MKFFIALIVGMLLNFCSCAPTNNGGGSGTEEPETTLEIAVENLTRAMEIVDAAVNHYFTGNGMKMSRYYNPVTGTALAETGSIWMYTSAIEAVNAVMNSLVALKDEGHGEYYDAYYNKYLDLLVNLYDNAEYYRGTFTLTSYTQTRQWSVFGVNRARAKGTANVEGVENVYDDQQWLIRELLESYKITGKADFLAEAEYLTSYVLDGWDSTLDESGAVYGGITWGPGYTTKHACSNGPMISPLVWLYEIYRNSDEQIVDRYVDTDHSRKSETRRKSTYYLDYAKAVYQWQKSHLLLAEGVYNDMMGGCSNCDIQYETIDGVSYRAHTALSRSEGPAISYNSGTMLSGAADLYRVTREKVYNEDLTMLAAKSFEHFAKLGATRPDYYTYDVSGFNDWFNGVLMRGYVDACDAGVDAATAVDSFQRNLDYGYDNYLTASMLPVNLLAGWSDTRNNNNVEGMFTFAFAAEYAILARYTLSKEK